MLAPDAATPNALKMWTDGVRIFVELPGHHGPVVLWYYYSEQGLAKALELLGQHRVDYEYVGAIPPGYGKAKVKDVQLAAREDVLRKLGIIK